MLLLQQLLVMLLISREVNHALEAVPAATLSSGSPVPAATWRVQVAEHGLDATALYAARESLHTHHAVG